MTDPYYSDDHATIFLGDCLTLSDLWIDAAVLVTDPPYGRSWRQGDTNSALGWASDRHDGIANDHDTTVRDAVLHAWGDDKPAVVFGDLMLQPPNGTKHVLIYDKNDAGFHGAIGGYRRNVEAIYLLGRHPSGLGGGSAILTTGKSGSNLAKETGHPHTKPVDLLRDLIGHCPPGVIVDPFMGSGSTLRAAKDLGRKAIGVELDERYCEVAARRLAQEVLDFGV